MSLLTLAGAKKGNSAPVLLQTVLCFQILDLDFLLLPKPFCPPPPLAHITTHTKCLFPSQRWDRNICPSQASLHLTSVSNNGGRSMELIYSSSNSTPKRPGHPTRSSCRCPEEQPSFKVFKEETQSTSSLQKVSLHTRTVNITHYKVQPPMFIPCHEEFTGNSLEVEA